MQTRTSTQFYTYLYIFMSVFPVVAAKRRRRRPPPPRVVQNKWNGARAMPDAVDAVAFKDSDVVDVSFGRLGRWFFGFGGESDVKSKMVSLTLQRVLYANGKKQSHFCVIYYGRQRHTAFVPDMLCICVCQKYCCTIRAESAKVSLSYTQNY